MVFYITILFIIFALFSHYFHILFLFNFLILHYTNIACSVSCKSSGEPRQTLELGFFRNFV